MRNFWIAGVILLLASCLEHIENPQGLTPRHGHAAVLVGRQILLMGGSIGTNDYTLHRYGYLVRDFPGSADGRTWTPVMSQGFFYGVGLRALEHDGWIYTSGGASSTPIDYDLYLENIVYTSPDGTNWTVASSLPAARRDHAFVYFGGKFWVLGGNLGQIDTALSYAMSNMRLANDVYASADNCQTWVEVLPNQEGTGRWRQREGHAAVAFSGKLWLIGGRRIVDDPEASILDYETLGDVWTSTDGAQWALVPQGGDANRWEALGRAFHQVVVLGDALYLIGGLEMSPKNRTMRVCGDIQKSVDGISWYTVAELPAPRYGHTATVKDNRIYIAGGRNESGALGDVVIYTP